MQNVTLVLLITASWKWMLSPLRLLRVLFQTTNLANSSRIFEPVSPSHKMHARATQKNGRTALNRQFTL
jgi:hypothetical protein